MNIHLRKFSKHYISEKHMQSLLGADYESYKQHLHSKLYKVLQPYMNRDGKLPVEYFVVYDYYRRINCDTHKMNMCNQYRYCVAPLADWRFLQYMTTPISTRDDAKILLRTIGYLYPQLLDIPFFSHQNWRKYDDVKKELIISDVDWSKTGTDHIISRHNPIRRLQIWSMLRPIYHFLRNPLQYKYSQYARESVSIRDISKQLCGIVSAFPYFKRKINPMESDYIPKEAHFALLLFTLNKLGINTLSDKNKKNL